MPTIRSSDRIEKHSAHCICISVIKERYLATLGSRKDLVPVYFRRLCTIHRLQVGPKHSHKHAHSSAQTDLHQCSAHAGVFPGDFLGHGAQRTHSASPAWKAHYRRRRLRDRHAGDMSQRDADALAAILGRRKAPGLAYSPERAKRFGVVVSCEPRRGRGRGNYLSWRDVCVTSAVDQELVDSRGNMRFVFCSRPCEPEIVEDGFCGCHCSRLSCFGVDDRCAISGDGRTLHLRFHCGNHLSALGTTDEAVPATQTGH